MKFRSGLVLLTFTFTARAAELKPQTLQAWQEYVQSAMATVQEQLRPDSQFLDIDADRNKELRVRAGEILISPGDSQSVRKVPSGIIHDCRGAAYITNARLDDVLPVVRDYDRYKEFYRPTVIDSKTLAKDGRADRFSMVLMNKSLFLKTALDSDYTCSSVRVNDRRSYTICETTRVQEIENYGAPGQRMLREDQGNGLIWRLMSITRFEERDGGVYIELEAIALSRDIPVSLRWVVEPMVRRISRSSLETSLRQTEDAVHASEALTASAGRGGLRSTCLPVPSNPGATHSFR